MTSSIIRPFSLIEPEIPGVLISILSEPEILSSRDNISFSSIILIDSSKLPRPKSESISLLSELSDSSEVIGYVLDVRSNPGGLLNQAVKVTDIFLERGEIVSTRGRNNGQAKRYSASKGDLALKKPIVVLINGGSASASEIVAGALQDHKRAIILGENSYGKGSVQSILPLKNNGAIRLTVSKYYLPSGDSISEIGVGPDIEIVEKSDDFRIDTDTDNQLKFAIKLITG